MLQRYPTIAVGMDFSPLAEVGLNAAAAQADRLGSSRLHLVHVYEHRTVLPLAAFGITAGPPPEVWEEARRGVHQRLEAIPVSGFNGRITRETRLGAPAEELIAASTEAQASLLLVASHDRVPAQRVVLGSVASTLLRASHCPVMVVGRDRPGTEPIGLVLAAVDLSLITEAVLKHAISIARAHGAKLKVLSSLDVPKVAPGFDDLLPRYLSRTELAEYPSKYRGAIDALLEKLCPSSVEVEVEVMSDDAPPHAILAASERYRPDLIVLGTSGHNAWQRFFLGSTATRVVADAHCPVFVVPHELAKVKDSTPSVIPTPVLAP
jgi:nucleotide-binding universal stress UspA family protein